MQTINAALCSFGMSGVVFHAPFIHAHPGFVLHGVLERTKELSREKYPQVIIYRSFEELLADEAVDLVVVNTPNYTHYDFTKQALLANKHVIVEKPFTATVSEGEELIALAKKQSKLISVFHNRRFDSDFQTVQKVVREGLLGEIVEAEIHFDRYKEELSPKSHKEVPGASTGSLYDLGSHLADQALQLFGTPSHIFGDCRIIRPNSQVDDYFDVTMYYPNLRVKLKSSYLVREPLAGFILHGSKGSFLKSKADVQEAVLLSGGQVDVTAEDWGVEPESERGLLHTEVNGKVIREHIPTLKGNYINYYDAMYKAMVEKQPVPVSAEDALLVIRLIETAVKSSREKKVLAF